MKQILLPLILVFFYQITLGQHLYSKDYGNKNNPSIVFIHGGPSGNSNLFEGTTAQKLADTGFYVIVYDRRGEGRSTDENAAMTFEESFKDLLHIYKTYNIEKAVVLGHSFGGIVASLFTNKYPEKVSTLVLAGALFSQQETYNHILKQAKKKFRNDTVKTSQILNIETLEKNTAEYRKRCYETADELNYFKMPYPTSKSEVLRQEYQKSEFYKTSFRNYQSPLKFYKNENHNNLNIKPQLYEIKKKGIAIFAVYGKDDNIFSKKQLADLQKITGRKNFYTIDNCSHYLFVDQQAEFLSFIENKLKK
ncbi:alpha/beta fold hydrolase [Flavobacterium sp. H122]|uniref:alpha/beta hydrolase n=1 Tax=Flavobacterium sp. H122 TaxID=2529860 RepID=UPI0010AA6B71|nr:alpha/beta hydrolase [Flavobacterium sp. H122]